MNFGNAKCNSTCQKTSSGYHDDPLSYNIVFFPRRIEGYRTIVLSCASKRTFLCFRKASKLYKTIDGLSCIHHAATIITSIHQHKSIRWSRNTVLNAHQCPLFRTTQLTAGSNLVPYIALCYRDVTQFLSTLESVPKLAQTFQK